MNVKQAADSVRGIRHGSGGIETRQDQIKDAEGRLLETAIPKVSIIKDASYGEDEYEATRRRKSISKRSWSTS